MSVVTNEWVLKYRQNFPASCRIYEKSGLFCRITIQKMNGPSVQNLTFPLLSFMQLGGPDHL